MLMLLASQCWATAAGGGGAPVLEQRRDGRGLPLLLVRPCVAARGLGDGLRREQGILD